MTDNEIVKALECCSTASCISNECPYEKTHSIIKCTTKLTKDALDLINRLQAENERLNNNISAMAITMRNSVKETKAEARKEFAEMLKNDWIGNLYYCEDLDITEWIDNLLKELVGE